MKPLLLFAFFCLQLLSYAQITFEEILSPKDFSLSAVRQSPTGEYFMQATNDGKSIYTSLNGHDWTKTDLPVSETLSDMQFYPDGTPVLSSKYNDHLIRRNGIWYTIAVTDVWGQIETCFVKGDTLFVLQDDVFAYSLDKGQTFVKMFTANGLFVHSANLWKIDNHLVLYYSIGATDYLAVYTEDGERVFYHVLDFGSYDVVYNDCGQVLFYDYDTYFLFKEQGLSLTSGNVNAIFPDFSRDMFSQGGKYFIRAGTSIYRTFDCNFNWETAASSNEIANKDKWWVNQQGDLFLYNNKSDFFSKLPNGSGTWEDYAVDIDQAYVIDVDESGQAHQIAITPNAMFSKLTGDSGWIELDSISGDGFEAQYSPDGDLYVNRRSDILYSTDNGHSFSTIKLPFAELPFNTYFMKVLGDDILFLINDAYGEGYYSVNNGIDWIPVQASYVLEYPIVKLVDDYILIAELSYQYTVTRIDLATNATTSVVLGDFYSLDYSGAVIQDDGTIYFQAMDLNGSNPEGLYRYRIGEGLVFIGQLEELAYIYSLETSGNDLYSFGTDGYYLLNGSSLEAYPFEGLPSTNVTGFYISANQYVYALIGGHRIFRSTKPLTAPQHVTGTIYHDQNNDCVENTSDATLQYWQVKVEGSEYMRIKTSDSDGHFDFAVPRGAYTLSTQPVNANWDLCEPAFHLTVDENTVGLNKDFLAFGLQDCASLELDFSTPRLRRCFDNYYSVRVRNTGPGVSDGTSLTFKLDPFFEFTSATIPYTLVGDSIVKFDLGVMAVNDEISFKMYFKLSCDAPLGIEHCLTGILNDDNICGDERSTYIECQENVGAIDPNDKRVFNEDGEEADRIDKGDYIYYHIRFQNTGTDTAFNVRVVDPLSPKMDLSTLEVLSASQSYEYYISDGPALVVLFDNILLPDSTINEPASHGFLRFRVKPLPEYDYGTSIPNQANIYFDFNDAVVTNEATMFILPPLATKEVQDLIDFNVFPNPASTELTLTISPNDGDRIDTYEIIDPLGRLISQSSYLNNGVISVAHLTAGIYNLVLKEKGNVLGMKKFVRM